MAVFCQMSELFDKIARRCDYIFALSNIFAQNIEDFEGRDI